MSIPLFYYPITVRRGDESFTVEAPYTDTLPSLSISDVNVVILSQPQGTLVQGLYIWTGQAWVLAMPYPVVCAGIIFGASMTVAWQLTHDVDFSQQHTQTDLTQMNTADGASRFIGVSETSDGVNAWTTTTLNSAQFGQTSK